MHQSDHFYIHLFIYCPQEAGLYNVTRRKYFLVYFLVYYSFKLKQNRLKKKSTRLLIYHLVYTRITRLTGNKECYKYLVRFSNLLEELVLDTDTTLTSHLCRFLVSKTYLWFGKSKCNPQQICSPRKLVHHAVLLNWNKHASLATRSVRPARSLLHMCNREAEKKRQVSLS